MRTAAFYKNLKIINLSPVSVCALVPAYLYAMDQFFCGFPDIKPTFFHKKNTLLGLSH